jgi:hypothetical protein
MRLTCLVATVLLAVGHTGYAMDSLSKYEWKNRVVVLFGDPQDDRLVRQIDILTSRPDEISDRDMVILHVDGDDVRSIFGDAALVNARQLRKEADINGDEFKALLVGKDGGIKLASAEVITDEKLFSLIDQMPMRRSERGAEK